MIGRTDERTNVGLDEGIIGRMDELKHGWGNDTMKLGWTNRETDEWTLGRKSKPIKTTTSTNKHAMGQMDEEKNVQTDRRKVKRGTRTDG